MTVHRIALIPGDGAGPELVDAARLAIEATGLRMEEVRENAYEFLTERALEACAKYGVVSVTLLARRED